MMFFITILFSLTVSSQIITVEPVFPIPSNHNWTESTEFIPDNTLEDLSTQSSYTPSNVPKYEQTYHGGSALIITGLIDGPPSGTTNSNPRVIEIYVLFDIYNLSLYGLGVTQDGTGSEGQEWIFPSNTAANKGDFIYLSYGDDDQNSVFMSFFGINSTNINKYRIHKLNTNTNPDGSDAIELYYNNTVIDTFGNINNGEFDESWYYRDGWSYRLDGTGPDGNNFIINNWKFSGINVFDGLFTNQDAKNNSFPIGTYLPYPNISNATTSTTQTHKTKSSQAGNKKDDVMFGIDSTTLITILLAVSILNICLLCFGLCFCGYKINKLIKQQESPNNTESIATEIQPNPLFRLVKNGIGEKSPPLVDAHVQQASNISNISNISLDVNTSVILDGGDSDIGGNYSGIDNIYNADEGDSEKRRNTNMIEGSHSLNIVLEEDVVNNNNNNNGNNNGNNNNKNNNDDDDEIKTPDSEELYNYNYIDYIVNNTPKSTSALSTCPSNTTKGTSTKGTPRKVTPRRTPKMQKNIA